MVKQITIAGQQRTLGMAALNITTAELKRMFVSPEARGSGLGRALEGASALSRRALRPGFPGPTVRPSPTR